MPAILVLGAQWGDEGKGKVTDVLAEDVDAVVRFQGGPNAGHTILVEGREFKLHHVPSGILRAGKLAVIGNGCVVDPATFLEEIDGLRDRGVALDGLRVSDRAHVILPHHRLLDGATEAAAGSPIGTTKRGIGPAYTDKVARHGLRVGELVRPRVLEARLAEILPRLATALRHAGAAPPDAAAVRRELAAAGERIAPFVTDTVGLLHQAHRAGKRILLEGAQGSLLDVDHGTYPYVTSSTTTAGGACAGSGLPPSAITEVLGVVKAYTTRVGGGPFPTELRDATGEHLATVGHEVGTTTGRRRRCGWLDLVQLRRAAAMNGFTSLAITKLDVLAGLGTLRVCEAYRMDGRATRDPPPAAEDLGAAEPVYREFAGFGALPQSPKAGGLKALPEEAQRYIAFLAKELGAPVTMVGTGPSRDDTIVA